MSTTSLEKENSLAELTPSDIENMTYFDLIGLLKETNRPPGGIKSIIRIAQHAFLSTSSKVLEIGTSTGFTAIELARLIGCSINAIDVNPQSLLEAKKRAQQCQVEHLVHLELQDAANTSYEDESFDVVFCGNVTSYMLDKKKTLQEYCRLMKPNGYLAAIPMYYIKEPSQSLIENVSKAIGTKIDVFYKKDWVKFFSQNNLHLFWNEDYIFDSLDSSTVNKFSDNLCSNKHLSCLQPTTLSSLREKYNHYMQLFRENLSHMGYSLMLFRKEPIVIDEELFSSTRCL